MLTGVGGGMTSHVGFREIEDEPAVPDVRVGEAELVPMNSRSTSGSDV